MNKFIKYFIVMNGLLLLNACADAPALKVKFYPFMPVPFLIVPDDAPKNNTHNNFNVYQEQRRNFEQDQWK
ncbi:MAG: hypothetical protein KAH08_01520 [Methylococcales bacterium]|nr:hypothetical protein [Methylococcales bacterium]